MDVQRKIRVIRILQVICVILTAHALIITLLCVLLPSSINLLWYERWTAIFTFYGVVCLSIAGLMAINRLRVPGSDKTYKLSFFTATLYVTFLCLRYFLTK